MAETKKKDDRLVVAVMVAFAGAYMVWRFLPPDEREYNFGTSQVPDDDDRWHAGILREIMRQTTTTHSFRTWLAQNPDYLTHDEVFERLFKAFGQKPYDVFWYKYNLPDFLFPKMSLAGWVLRRYSEQEVSNINQDLAERGISYRF